MYVQCSIPRDQVFSLRALLREGKRITVDCSMSASELAYHLLKLYKRPLCVTTVLQLHNLTRDKGAVSKELIDVSRPFVKFQVSFTRLESRATIWQSAISLYVVYKPLCGQGLGSETALHGKGFTITRIDNQSLMINVQVAPSVLSRLLDSLDPWLYYHVPIIKHPSFDAEFQAWVERSIPHLPYT